MSMRAILFVLFLAAATQAVAAPLDFVTPPIHLDTLYTGICTGDRSFAFTDHRGKPFEISVPNSASPSVSGRANSITIVHGETTLQTVDGDDTQKTVLRWLTDAKTRIKAERQLSDKDEWRFRVLDILISELSNRIGKTAPADPSHPANREGRSR